MDLAIVGAVIEEDFTFIYECSKSNPYLNLAFRVACQKKKTAIAECLLETFPIDMDWKPIVCNDCRSYGTCASNKDHHTARIIMFEVFAPEQIYRFFEKGNIPPKNFVKFFIHKTKFLKLAKFFNDEEILPHILEISSRNLEQLLEMKSIKSDDVWKTISKKIGNPFQCGTIIDPDYLRNLFKKYPLSKHFERIFEHVWSALIMPKMELEKTWAEYNEFVRTASTSDEFLATVDRDIFLAMIAKGAVLSPVVVYHVVNNGRSEIYEYLFDFCNEFGTEKIATILSNSSNKIAVGLFIYQLLATKK